MTSRRRRLLALALPAALLLPGAAGASSPSPQASEVPAGTVRLSNERTSTRWAHPVGVAPIRSAPRPQARVVAPTHLDTEDGFPEVYVALRSWQDPRGGTWIRIRIPMRPNGRTGWVRRSALGPLYRVRTLLIVDRPKLSATLYRRGLPVWRAPVGIGKASTPTPAGRFWIREKFRTADSDGLYGPVAFGSSDYSVLSEWPGGGVIGIHGTNEPSLIPGRPSHGCIRLRNSAARQLWRRLPIGTPLLIGKTAHFLARRSLSARAGI
jgi:hypothetical protein